MLQAQALTRALLCRRLCLLLWWLLALVVLFLWGVFLLLLGVVCVDVVPPPLRHPGLLRKSGSLLRPLCRRIREGAWTCVLHWVKAQASWAAQGDMKCAQATQAASDSSEK